MNDQLWNKLLNISCALDNYEKNGDVRLEELRQHLESVEVVYHKQFDPVDSFEEYVAVALCRSINLVLSRDQS